MSRGERREEIFRDDEVRQRFPTTPGEGCAKTGWQAHALCLAEELTATETIFPGTDLHLISSLNGPT